MINNTAQHREELDKAHASRSAAETELTVQYESKLDQLKEVCDDHYQEVTLHSSPVLP